MGNGNEGGVLIVHLSDIHTKHGDVVCSRRISALAGPIGSLRENFENVAFLVTGDIAFSGKKAEYESIFDEFVALAARLRAEWSYKAVDFYACPGNHDVDFDVIAAPVREALLGGLNGDAGDQLQVIETLARSQEAFFDFLGAANPEIEVLNPLLRKAKLEFDGRRIELWMLNSSWSSRLEERAGALRLPVEALPFVESDAEFVVALCHHPLNWYTPQDGKALSEWLDLHVDLTLWGHEHREDSFQIARRKYSSSVEHFLALPVCDDSTTCGFRTIGLDAEGLLVVTVFEWRGDRFEQATSSQQALTRNPGRSLGQIRFTSKFKAFLQDIGASFKHERLERQLQLADVFIEPGFKSYTASVGDEERLDISTTLAAVCDEIREESDVAFYGPEQSGKTTFAKYLIEDARHLGITPLYFDASALQSTNRGQVTAWIQKSISNQYESDCLDQIQQLEPSRKIVILDNVHQLHGSATAVRDVIERLKHYGSRRVLLTAQNPAITILAASNYSGDEIKLWSDKKWYELLPLNNQRRGELIRRWCALGRDEHTESESIEMEVRQVKRVLDAMLGRNFMPKYPLFLLALLQQVEIAKDAKTVIKNGSHGYIFDALVTSALDNSQSSHDLDIIHDFLGRVAFKLWSSESQKISESGFQQLIQDLKRVDFVELSHPGLMRDLINSKVLVSEGALVSFRYNYFYYYYLAKWLASHRDLPEAERMLDEFISSIHTEMSANVVMFVAHFGHEAWVSEKLLIAATELFPSAEECVLFERSKWAIRYTQDQNEVVLLDGAAPAVSNQHHQEEDSKAPENPESMEDAFKFNTAAKIIQTLGQILRSRAGNIEGEDKVRIARACTSLARRLMSTLYDVAEESASTIVENASELFETEIKIDSREARSLANRFVAAVIGGIAKSLVSRAADVVATRDLMPLIDRLEEMAVKEGDIDNELIALVARTIASGTYQKERVEAILRRLGASDVLSRAALAHAVARTFYLQPPPHAIRDSACERLGIRVKKVQARFPGQDVSGRGGTNPLVKG